jgi:hypothetical protein
LTTTEISNKARLAGRVAQFASERFSLRSNYASRGMRELGSKVGEQFLVGNYHEPVISSGPARPPGGRAAESRDLVVKMRHLLKKQTQGPTTSHDFRFSQIMLRSG